MNNKKEIIWNIVNSLLAAGLVMLGAFTDGKITYEGFIAALIAGAVVAITQFKDYWKREECEYSSIKTFGTFL
jgi:hypothetical protein